MGQRWTVELTDSAGQRWSGEHVPELMDLRPLLGALVELDPVEAEEPEAWRKILPQGLTFVRMLGPRSAHLHTREAPIQDIVVKVVLPKTGSALRRLTEQLRHSRSQRAYLWGHRLRAFGIDTPRPLGYAERESQPALFPSFHVTQYIFAPTLIEVTDRDLALEGQGGDAAIMRKRLLIQRVAGLYEALHRQGLFHADLHGGNILVDEEALYVIDLESMRTFGLRGREVLRNLVRLNRDFLDRRRVSRTDRMRFLRAYLAHAGGADAEARRLFTTVAERTEAKLIERREAFSPPLPRVGPAAPAEATTGGGEKFAPEPPAALEKQA